MATTVETQHDVTVEYVRRKGWLPYCRTCRWEGVTSRSSQASAWDTARAHRQNVIIAAGKRAQAAFVARWRAEHPDEVYDAAWICPLCNKAIQSFDASTTPKLVIGVHQINHGRAWTAYQEAAGQPDRAG
jgi:deoxyxylulose-5-phosphate synthase